MTIPKNWDQYHSQECGTAYRGCAPGCPKDHYEKTGKWIGPEPTIKLALSLEDARALRVFLERRPPSITAARIEAMLSKKLEDYE